jgi:hypothetical protein
MSLFVGADVLDLAEGCSAGAVVAAPLVPTGVAEQGMFTKGLPRNLGDPVCSFFFFPVGDPGYQAPGSLVLLPDRGERNREEGRYRRTKATK